MSFAPISRFVSRRLLLTLACSSLMLSSCAAQTPERRKLEPKFPPRAESRIPDLPDLKCRLHKRKPALDYEFRFFAPYWVNIPLKRLREAEGRLNATTVIQPLSIEGAEPIRLRQKLDLPNIPEHAKGAGEFSGAFALGEGEYEVVSVLRDGAGRSCRMEWKLKAKLPGKHRDIAMTAEPGEVVSARLYLFRPEEVIQGDGTNLRVKVLMNLDASSRRRAQVRLWEYASMVSGLRMMSRHPALAEFSVVAFSLDEQRVFHRQDVSDRVDFPALRDAIESLTPATVDYKHLRKGSDIEFLDELLTEELNPGQRLDAVIFVGADDRYGKRVSPEALERVRAKKIPVFHFNTTRLLWRGAIGNAVKSLGGKEYRVRSPYDLAKAIDKLVDAILVQRPNAENQPPPVEVSARARELR